MKTNLLLLFGCACLHLNTAFAKNYYISSSGNDANNGLTQGAPWKTIAKVNASFSSITAGDSILFKRGDLFYGALVVAKSGSIGKPIVISAYGSGNKPVITGFVTPASWTLVSPGIYQASVPNAKSSLNMVTFDGIPKALGRYPNATEPYGGYLTYESFSGYTSITDSQLTGATNWAGAEAVIRKHLWVIDRCKITAHNGSTLTYTNTNNSTYPGIKNYGYFIQNDVRTLDQLGEWYFNNSGKKLQMYFGTADPNTYVVKVSTIDTLLRLVTRSYINVNNISFEGANGNAIYSNNGSYINIQNCDFIYSGIGSIYTQGLANLLIENCTSNYSLNNAFIVNSGSYNNVTIKGCAVKNNGILPGWDSARVIRTKPSLQV